jgi:hypothetical protein
MVRCAAVVVVLVLFVACKKEAPPEPPPPPEPPAAQEPAPPPPPPAPPAPKAAEPAAAGELPKAEDVLPSGEVSPGSLVVTGEGFRFQVKPEFKKIEHPKAGFAYHAKIKGIIKEGELTLYVTREPFKGKLAALVARESKRVTDAGGKLGVNTPVKIKIAGAMSDAHRFRAKGKDTVDLHVMAVHGGFAYIFHCETPNVPMAWPNVGSDCMIRGSTFHVAPPK